MNMEMAEMIRGAPLPTLVLASTSPYRRELVERLRWPFTCLVPDVDEVAGPDESPAALSERLAEAKAMDVARRWARDSAAGVAVVVGSDQVAELDGQALGKPGGHEAARAQLRRQSGREVLFHTSVCVARSDVAMPVGRVRSVVRVRFRALSDEDIETYLALDRPYDCAGSAKCETLGIALLEAVHSDDPTALIGLPLIATTRLLRQAGLDVLRREA